MPRSPKIISPLTQAMVPTYINDNSGTEPLTYGARPTVDTSFKTLCIFGADKGLDNKLLYIPPTQWERFQSTYGIPNFAKYGQCALHPYNFLAENPNTGVWAMRVLPNDAAYSNAIVVAHYGVQKVSTEVPTLDGQTEVVTEDRFQIMYTVEHYLPDGTDVGCLTDEGDHNSLRKAAEQWYRTPTDTPDENGWYTAPVMAIRTMGHGKYGNKFSFKFERDISAERDRNMKLFKLSILDSFQATVYKSVFRGSLINSTTGEVVSSFEDAIDDMGYDANIHVIQFQDTIVDIFDAYQKYLDTVSVETITDTRDKKIFDTCKAMIVDQFDPIFGLILGTNNVIFGLDIVDEPLPMYNDASTLDPRYADAENIKFSAGMKLDGGTDGSFDKPPVGTTFQEIYDRELVKAFQGAKDVRIIDKYRVPIDFMFDANYSFTPDDDERNVKYAMYLLNNARCRNRYDNPDTGAGSILFLDAGQDYTDITNVLSDPSRVDPNWTFEMNSDLLNLTRSFSQFNNRITSMEFQHGTIYDPFTKKRIVVTSLWNMTRKYIPMLQSQDIMIPFAGKANAEWDDILPNTLTPAITNIDLDVKEELENQRFNYYQYDGGAETGSEIVVRMSQNTRQTEKTALTNENNMVVLNCYANGVEKFCRGKLWNFNDPVNQKSFTDEINARYEGWQGTKCVTLRTYFTADTEDRQHDIIRCQSAIQFRNLVKTIISEIDITNAVYDEDYSEYSEE